MSKKIKFKSKLTEQIVVSVLLLVLGILFCFKIGTNVLSIIIGVALCVYGLVGIILIASSKKSLLTVNGIFLAVIIALGIVFMAENFLEVFVSITPYIITTIGFLVILDALLFRFMKNKRNLFVFIIELVIGGAAAGLGLALILSADFRASAQIIFGVVLIAGAALNIISIVSNKKKEKKED